MKEHFGKKFRKTLITFIIALLILNIALQISKGNSDEEIDDTKNSSNNSGPMAVFSKIAKHTLLSKEEKVFLVIFQNNMELRPGGGFIGSFGIIKIKDKKITDFAIHDTANFDGRIPSTVPTPYPMGEMLHIDSWKLRDSNYSPDFSINAKKAEEFYYAGEGEEEFDGIIAINASVLEPVLEVLGPVTVEGAGDFDHQNVLIALEKQVEVDYVKQGIEQGDRKKIMNKLFSNIMKKAEKLSLADKLKLAKVFVRELNKKEIQLYFDDEELQKSIANSGWSGELNKSWKNDYLMLVDANLGGYKSDYYMKRKMDYYVDFSKDKPSATLKITHYHSASEKDWMTNDYQGYMRVYVPTGSWLVGDENIQDIQIGKELNKKYFGKRIFVPVGEIATVEFEYQLPDGFSEENYDLLFQKQSGMKNIVLNVTIKHSDGTEKKVSKGIDRDFVLSKREK